MSKYSFKPTEPMMTFEFMFGVEGFHAQKKMFEDMFNALDGKIKLRKWQK